MKVKVSEIPEEGLDLSEKVSIRVNDSEVPAELALHMDKSGPDVLVRGMISARMELTCGRCLKRFERQASLPVELVYRPVEELEEETSELEPGELDTGFYKDDELDTEGLAAEQLILSVPIKVLCDEACKGICPSCGTDLNAGKCACPAEKTGGFHALKKHIEERRENG